MLLLLGFIDTVKESQRVQSMTEAIQPVVGVMLAVLAYEFFHNAWKDVGRIKTVIISAFSFLALEWMGVHPAVTIALLLLYGAALAKKQAQKQEKKADVSL